MNAPHEELLHIECHDRDGDECVPPFELLLWHMRALAQRTFDVELIFHYEQSDYTTESHERIQFFVPRDHRRVAEVETWLVKGLALICSVGAESRQEGVGWRPGVYVDIYRYSGIPGALAFINAQEEALQAGEALDHPDWGRLATLAREEGRQAARRTKRRR